MIRLIVTDLDGTLLKPARGMSKVNREALLKAQRMGIIVALATGRNHETVKAYAKLLQLKEHGGYLIFKQWPTTDRYADESASNQWLYRD